MMWSKYKKYPNKNISSISLKFLLFFFQKLGIRNMTVVDFSCGMVESKKDENRKQGWTDSSSASDRSASSSKKSSPLAEIGLHLKDAGVEEVEAKVAHGKSRRQRRTKGHTKRRSNREKNKIEEKQEEDE